MQSSATTVVEYLKTVPPERLNALKALRELCCRCMVEYEESMHYEMPCYSRHGTVEISFKSQKNYIALYVLKKDVLDRYRDALKNVGKGCIRYSKPAEIDYSIVEKLLLETVVSTETVC